MTWALDLEDCGTMTCVQMDISGDPTFAPATIAPVMISPTTKS